MDADFFRTLFGHHYWARDKVLAAADGMTEDDYSRPNGFTYGSIRGILTHTLSAEVIWFGRARGEAVDFAALPREENVPSVDALKQRWASEESQQRAFLQKLADADVKRDVVFTGRDGNEFRQPLWQLLMVVYSHSIQHRSEAAEALTMVGRSPGNLDLLIYTRERQRA